MSIGSWPLDVFFKPMNLDGQSTASTCSKPCIVKTDDHMILVMNSVQHIVSFMLKYLNPYRAWGLIIYIFLCHRKSKYTHSRYR